jgi:hypothetical protein
MSSAAMRKRRRKPAPQQHGGARLLRILRANLQQATEPTPAAAARSRRSLRSRKRGQRD